MAGPDKRVASYEAALEGLTDGMTLLAGGFGLCGIPENLIAEVQRRQVQGLPLHQKFLHLSWLSYRNPSVVFYEISHPSQKIF